MSSPLLNVVVTVATTFFSRRIVCGDYIVWSFCRSRCPRDRRTLVAVISYRCCGKRTKNDSLIEGGLAVRQHRVWVNIGLSHCRGTKRVMDVKKIVTLISYNTVLPMKCGMFRGNGA